MASLWIINKLNNIEDVTSEKNISISNGTCANEICCTRSNRTMNSLVLFFFIKSILIFVELIFLRVFLKDLMRRNQAYYVISSNQNLNNKYSSMFISHIFRTMEAILLQCFLNWTLVMNSPYYFFGTKFINDISQSIKCVPNIEDCHLKYSLIKKFKSALSSMVKIEEIGFEMVKIKECEGDHRVMCPPSQTIMTKLVFLWFMCLLICIFSLYSLTMFIIKWQKRPRTRVAEIYKMEHGITIDDSNKKICNNFVQ